MTDIKKGPANAGPFFAAWASDDLQSMSLFGIFIPLSRLRRMSLCP